MRDFIISKSVKGIQYCFIWGQWKRILSHDVIHNHSVAAVVAESAEGGAPFLFKEHKSLALVWPKWPPLSFSSHFEVPFLLELMWLQPLERWHIQERAVKELYTLIETWGYVQVVTSENNAPMEHRSPWSNESVITIPGISDSIAEGKNASQRFLKSA